MNLVKNFFGHLKTISKHKFIVFKLSIKAGIPLRGLVHDLSKFSPEEFFESVKYYTGYKSPIVKCKEKKGYSRAWLHHKGRNKHHFEYWYDFNSPENTPIIPYKYAAEMVCDTVAAAITYHKKDFKEENVYNYFVKRKDLEYINPKIVIFLKETYKELIKKGINNTIRKNNLKKLYKKYVLD